MKRAAAARHLRACSVAMADWTGTLDAYEGLHTVPLVTNHKSKGLEYHTVIFVGLDDRAWWRPHAGIDCVDSERRRRARPCLTGG